MSYKNGLKQTTENSEAYLFVRCDIRISNITESPEGTA